MSVNRDAVRPASTARERAGVLDVRRVWDNKTSSSASSANYNLRYLMFSVIARPELFDPRRPAPYISNAYRIGPRIDLSHAVL